MSIMGIPVIGRDLFKDGQSEIDIRLLGIIPLASVKGNPKINESALQRYLGEICWFPTAALNPYIKWEGIDEKSSKATMSYKGTIGSAFYYFNNEGDLTQFVALRYYNFNDSEPKEWIGKVLDYNTFNGIRIPSIMDATWVLKSGKFTWYKFEIQGVEFNKL